jgi:PPOX class probable FMN-dependent enzyme
MQAQVDSWQITSVDELEAIIGTPSELIRTKETPYLTPLIREFILASPYVLLATAAADGTCDVTPRGDPPGAIAVIDERTIAIPDRLGNRRVDSMRNIISNPHIGMFFLIPGVDETVRVNGRATITREPGLLEQLAVNGKLPKVAIVVEIEEVFAHCARSILRSKLWEPESWPDPDTIPTLAAIMAEQKQLALPDESDGKRNEEYRKVLY